MGSLSVTHWIIVATVVLAFGGGRIFAIMADVAKGIKGVKRELSSDLTNTSATPHPTPNS